MFKNSERIKTLEKRIESDRQFDQIAVQIIRDQLEASVKQQQKEIEKLKAIVAELCDYVYAEKD